jgi:hypothetical protein
MVALKNWEIEAVTGAAISGATVEVYVATDSHPNLTSPVATTATDLSGMWEFTSLADGNNYDIKVTAGARVKWYKGNTKHNIGHLYDDTTPDPNRNLASNGGQDSWIERGTGAITLPTADPGVPNTADGWTTYIGPGDSGTAQLDTSIVATNSKGSLKATYNRSGGQLVHYRDIPDIIWQGLKGKVIAVSAQIDNIATSSEPRVFIDDGVGITTGSVVSTTGAFATISASRTINVAATRVRIGVQTNRSDTGSKVFYIDNIMMDITSVAPVYAPDADDVILAPQIARATIVESTPATDSNTIAGLLNALAGRARDIIGAAGNDWKDAVPRTLTQVFADLALKANISGVTFTGNVSIGAAAQFLLSTSDPTAYFKDLTHWLSWVNASSKFLFSDKVEVAGDLEVSGPAKRFLLSTTDPTVYFRDLTHWLSWVNASSKFLFSGDLVEISGGLTISGVLKKLLISSTDASVYFKDITHWISWDDANARFLLSTASFLVGGNQVIHAGNIGSQAVASATTAGSATTAVAATNSSQLGGVAASGYSLLPSVGAYAGDNSASRTIVLGFQPSYVLITVPDADPGAGVTAYLCHLMSTTVGQNFQMQVFPATSQASSAVMSVSALAATGFVVGNLDGNNVTGITYRYVAFR